MGTRAPVRCARGRRSEEKRRWGKQGEAARLAFPTAASPLISPRLCGPPTGLTNEANPRSMKGCSELVVPGPHGRKVGKLLRKNMRKPHFRGREGRKVTNRPRAVGVPVSFATYTILVRIWGLKSPPCTCARAWGKCSQENNLLCKIPMHEHKCTCMHVLPFVPCFFRLHANAF